MFVTAWAGSVVSCCEYITVLLVNDCNNGYQRLQPCWPTVRSVVMTNHYKMGSCSSSELAIEVVQVW